jgi:CHAT domain-containing protein/Tfp pilus assembly protein PilF
VAQEDGAYCLEIEAAMVAQEGARAFRMRLEPRRTATPRERIRAAGHLAFSQAERLRRQGKHQMALPLYREALADFERSQDQERLGPTFYWLGDLRAERGDYGGALQWFAEAVQAFAGSPEEAMADNRLGITYEILGKKDQARKTLQQGLAIAQRFGDLRREAGARNNLGRLFQGQVELQEALKSFTAALDYWRHGESPADWAIALSGLADCHLDLGNLEAARDTALEAIRVERLQGDFRRESGSRRTLGQAYLRLGDPTAAVREAETALRLARKAGDPASEASALQVLGDVDFEANQLEPALRYYEQALACARPTGSPEVTARALMGVGVVRGLRGDRALESLSEAASLLQQNGDDDGRAWVLEQRAWVLRRQGRFAEALPAIEEALSILETLRSRPPSASLRSSFLASRYSAWELAADILVELEGQKPGQGYGVRSFEIGESVRARTFLDDLTVSGVAAGSRVPPEKQRRRAEIEQQLAELEKAEGPDQVEARHRLRTERDLLEDAIRAVDPGYLLIHARPLTLTEAQALLADDKTTLLAYMLGDEHSFLWRVRRDSLECLSLPPRRQIEALARGAHEALGQPTGRARGSLDEALAQLSKTLLGTVASSLGKDRLLVVADGALQTVPFGVLPVSRGRLIDDHVVVHLPSLSVVAALRRETAKRPHPPKEVAVLADAVYGEDDQRFPAARRRPATPLPVGPLDDVARSARDLKVGRFDRLPQTGEEARAILQMVSPGMRLEALGFAADRRLALGPELARYRILHFATHAVFDAIHPELSGIILSRFDREGHPQEGFLRAYEIDQLRLPVDLVVLSACQTALGSEVRGEGLSGLPRGFMYAGAPRVVVSLWKVSDKATARLMEVFYRGLLREKLRPAEALRAAQIEMMHSRDWHEPYYWAGFVLNGDWS